MGIDKYILIVYTMDMEYDQTYLLKATPEDMQMLSDLAADDGVSMAEWLRTAIREAWYARQSQPAAEEA